MADVISLGRYCRRYCTLKIGSYSLGFCFSAKQQQCREQGFDKSRPICNCGLVAQIGSLENAVKGRLELTRRYLTLVEKFSGQSQHAQQKPPLSHVPVPVSNPGSSSFKLTDEAMQSRMYGRST